MNSNINKQLQLIIKYQYWLSNEKPKCKKMNQAKISSYPNKHFPSNLRIS